MQIAPGTLITARVLLFDMDGTLVDSTAAVERIWGREPDLEVLLSPPGPGEDAEGETTRLGAFAARLWGPLLAAEDGA